MSAIKKTVQRFILAVLACTFAVSSTTSAVSYQYRAINDQLWYEEGCEPTSTTMPSPVSDSKTDDSKDSKIAKIMIPLFDSGNKAGALAAIEKYKFGGMAMTGDGKVFDKAFFDDAKSKAGGSFIPMADEEGGGVARYGIANKAASDLAKMSNEDIKKEGQRVAEGLKGYGIEVDLAPILDIEKPGVNNHLQQGMSGKSRAFGTDAKTVTEKAGAFAEGLSAGGIKPTYKHFPGLGQATAHTDYNPATLDYSKLGEDLKPFQSLANQHSGLVMLSNAKIIGLGGDEGTPAPTNKRLIEKLRGEVGFGGTIITDDLDAITKWPGGGTLPDVVFNSFSAGADLLLFRYPGDAMMDQIIEKFKNDASDDRLNEAYSKYQSTGSSSKTADTKTTPSGGGNACECGTGGASSVSATTGDGGGCGEKGYASGKRDSKANKDQIWSYFKGKGLSDIAVAGIMGNIEQESAFMPDAVNSLGCKGIVQWCYDRVTKLESFAKERGKSWDCLGLQLEFIWHEVTQTGESGVMKNLNAAKTPGAAGDVWAVEYERMAAHEQAGRSERAEKIYKEYTGKEASALSGGSTAECPDSTSGAAPMSEDCAALVAKYKQLRGSKLTETSGKDIDQDLANCTTDPIQCGTSSGGGGVHPKLLRALVAAVENSGGETTRVWNINTRHPCDGLNHPNGKASDLYCEIPSRSNRGEGPSKEKCLRIFKYLYDHYEELGLSELIWNENTPFSKIGDGKHMSVAGHEDHIHIGVKS